jgi:hypothetical protein
LAKNMRMFFKNILMTYNQRKWKRSEYSEFTV